MGDDRKGPPRRLPTSGDRNEARRVLLTPSRGVLVDPNPGVPVNFEQPITGVHENPLEELLARTRKTQHVTESAQLSLTGVREEFRAELGAVKTEVRDIGTKQLAAAVTLARIEGVLEVMPALVDSVKQSADRMEQREHLTFTARVDVDHAKEIDKVEAGRTRREWVTELLKIAAAVAGGGGLLELAHRLGGC